MKCEAEWYHGVMTSSLCIETKFFLLYEENCFGFLNAVAAFGSHNALSIEGGYYVRSLQPQSGREEVAESLG